MYKTKKFTVKIEAITNTDIEVEAETKAEALNIAQDMINDRNIVFDDHTHACTFDEITAYDAEEVIYLHDQEL